MGPVTHHVGANQIVGYRRRQVRRQPAVFKFRLRRTYYIGDREQVRHRSAVSLHGLAQGYLVA